MDVKQHFNHNLQKWIGTIHTANTILLTDSIQYLPRIIPYKMDLHIHIANIILLTAYGIKQTLTMYHSLQNRLAPFTLQTPFYGQTAYSTRQT